MGWLNKFCHGTNDNKGLKSIHSHEVKDGRRMAKRAKKIPILGLEPRYPAWKASMITTYIISEVYVNAVMCLYKVNQCLELCLSLMTSLSHQSSGTCRSSLSNYKKMIIAGFPCWLAVSHQPKLLLSIYLLPHLVTSPVKTSFDLEISYLAYKLQNRSSLNDCDYKRSRRSSACGWIWFFKSPSKSIVPILGLEPRYAAWEAAMITTYIISECASRESNSGPNDGNVGFYH